MMFLHSGASLHGHEYSPRSPLAASPQGANLRSPLIRSALTPAKARTSRTADGVPPPALRQRPASEYIPRKASTPEPVVRFQEEEKPTPVTHDDSLLSESELSEATAFSIDGPSKPGRGRGKRRRHAPHQTTKYFLGYPAPRRLPKTKVMQKVLSRLLLQLQVVTDDGRSRPVLEAYPSTRIAGPVVTPRLAKRFPGIFGVKRQLGYDDIVLVRRDDEDFGSDAETDADDSLEKKLLLAVYSPIKHSDEAEIVLDDGSIWVAKPLANGSFDFVHTDVHGVPTTVRWARRNPCGKVSGDVVPGLSSTDPPQTRYTFSVINPLTRRHPVMATLTPTTLDVQDTYTSISSSYGKYPPHRTGGRTVSMTSSVSWGDTVLESSKRPSTGSTDTEGMFGLASEVEPTRTVRPVEDSTKMLIAVTGLWVALKSGWSANISPTNSDLAQSCVTTRSRRNTWTRATSEVGGNTPQISEAEEPASDVVLKRHSMPLTVAEKQQVVPSPSRTPTPPKSPRGSPRRATSTGAAFMLRRHQRLEATGKDMGREMKSKRRKREPADLVEVLSHGQLDGVVEEPSFVGDKDVPARRGIRTRIFRWMHRLGGR